VVGVSRKLLESLIDEPERSGGAGELRTGEEQDAEERKAEIISRHGEPATAGRRTRRWSRP